MNRLLIAGTAMLAATVLPVAGHAQGTVKIGVISAYSGQFADTAVQIDNGIKLYVKQHGDTVAARRSKSSARTPAVRTRTSPSAWRRN